jgi:predicted MPP superfamily phosphohydrolase
MQAAAILILFLGACLGHTAVLVFSINWWYGQALPHRFLFVLRVLHGVIILVGIWAFAQAYVSSRLAPGELFSGPGWPLIAGIYTAGCALVGVVVVPWITIQRRLRRPAVLLGNHTAAVDFANELGYKPVGRGKYRWLARLPGNQVFQVDFVERTLRLPRLPPALEGLTIVQVTDLHFCGSPGLEFFQRVMDRCRAWNPDLLAVTGDLVDSDKHHRWIVPVLGRLRWGTAAFGILGNHDSWRDVPVIRRRLRRLGIEVLANGWKEIKVRDERVVFIGHEGPWFRPPPDLTGCPQDTFRICLSHTPDNIRWAQERNVDLMLSGHNHGGQVRFPLVGSLLVPSRYGRRYDCGVFEEPPTILHVSRGLSGQHPVRYHCRPEVTKIVLTK